MKLNQGFIPTIILFLAFAASISFLVYVEPDHYGLGKIKLFSFLNDQIEEITNPDAPTGPLPVVDVGPDISIKYPRTSILLKGTATADDGEPLTYEWFKLSGGLAKVASPFDDTTAVTGLKKGKYLFRLIVTDSKGVKSADEVYVTMEGGPAPVKVAKKSSAKSTQLAALPNSSAPQAPVPTPLPTITPNPTGDLTGAPVSDAGPNQTITLPTSSVTLHGYGTDSGALIVSYNWIQTEGASATIESPSQGVTSVSDLTAGSYKFELIVTDSQGFSATDTVVVTVNNPIEEAENNPPEADAGPDQSITLPTDSVTLSGSGTDSDGQIVSYSWSQIGSGQATITSPDSATTTVTGLEAGTYIFRLIVMDNQDGADSNTVTITVNEASQAPTE